MASNAKSIAMLVNEYDSISASSLEGCSHTAN
jgi:hypothetical protein